jgi:uncharacterized protein (DUF952 family)
VAQDWENAKSVGHYYGGDLDTSSGFLHLSTANQVEGTLDIFYKGQTGLVLLILALKDGFENRELKFEEVHGSKFPHLYSTNESKVSLKVDEVAEVVSLKVNVDSGKFNLPQSLTDAHRNEFKTKLEQSDEDTLKQPE